jgi:ABC-2 type transport system ATP-binding protein
VEPVITTRSLTRYYGQQPAVQDLDLEIAAGEVFGFLGPNGAGKTTTVRLLNGVLSPSSGTAQVLGFDVATEPQEIRKRTGVLTETPNLYEALTARENLRFYGDLYHVPENRLARRSDELLDEFGLIERADDPVGTYSKGMRQRLAIARALLHEPPLVFLDEPTSGLDPAAARMVTNLIQQLSHQHGRTIFLCTHNLNEAQRLCDRVGVIDRGALRAIGSPKELAQELWQTLWIQVELRGEPSARVRQALEQSERVLGWALEDGLVAIQVAKEEMIPDVVGTLVAAGARIYGLRQREHTLEEIYFRVQEKEHKEEAS